MHSTDLSSPLSISSVVETLERSSTVDGAERAALEDDLVAQFLPMANALARRYSHRGVDVDDLQQVAALALLKAIRGFETEGGNFVGYARATILGEIKKYFRDHAWVVRPTRRIQEMQPLLNRAVEELGAGMPSGNRVQQLSSMLQVAPSDVAEALAARTCFSPSSLDKPMGFSGRTVGETVAESSDDAEHVDDMDLLKGACGCLDADEKELIYLRFFEERTQSEIGELIGVSQMQVSRLLRRALAKLRAAATGAAA